MWIPPEGELYHKYKRDDVGMTITHTTGEIIQFHV